MTEAVATEARVCGRRDGPGALDGPIHGLREAVATEAVARALAEPKAVLLPRRLIDTTGGTRGEGHAPVSLL